MKQKTIGQLGDWTIKRAEARPIEIEIKTKCLELFKQNVGYRKTARMLGLSPKFLAIFAFFAANPNKERRKIR